mmetsp:Transcript_12028/g.46800  ORF Transcript_12028/g.46800 Transcript_12028/m.46800 type:complete len:352 (+) Transcript_12028:66-1121(+)
MGQAGPRAARGAGGAAQRGQEHAVQPAVRPQGHPHELALGQGCGREAGCGHRRGRHPRHRLARSRHHPGLEGGPGEHRGHALPPGGHGWAGGRGGGRGRRGRGAAPGAAAPQGRGCRRPAGSGRGAGDQLGHARQHAGRGGRGCLGSRAHRGRLRRGRRWWPGQRCAGAQAGPRGVRRAAHGRANRRGGAVGRRRLGGPGRQAGGDGGRRAACRVAAGRARAGSLVRVGQGYGGPQQVRRRGRRGGLGRVVGRGLCGSRRAGRGGRGLRRGVGRTGPGHGRAAGPLGRGRGRGGGARLGAAQPGRGRPWRGRCRPARRRSGRPGVGHGRCAARPRWHGGKRRLRRQRRRRG